MSKFYIVNNSTFQNAIACINDMRAKGITPLVSISEKKEDRSSAQNRLMHQWFKDISNQTNNGIEYEAGRCKIAYFLPVMARSDDEEIRAYCKKLREIYRNMGHEFLSNLLGSSQLASTSLLGVKDFAEAMTNMYRAEYQYRLTDPQTMGLDGRF